MASGNGRMDPPPLASVRVVSLGGKAGQAGGLSEEEEGNAPG